MPILLLGLFFWWAGHGWKRVRPERHSALGDKARGVSAILILIGVVLMIFGYRSSETVDLWAYPAFLKHINNLAMVFSLYFFSPGPKKGALFHKLRHPMLTGMIIWCLAHLLVNPDAASFVLFGGLLLWSLSKIAIINQAEPEWTPGPKGTLAKDAMFFIASIVLVLVIGYIHGLIGPSPFGM